MATRAQLHDKLRELVGDIVGERIYFQPPDGFRMKYPCVIYNAESPNALYADDTLYNVTKHYTITVIDRDPDSEIPIRLYSLPYARPEKPFVHENLYHYNLSIFY